MYAFAREHDVPHVRCGKLVVAQEDEVSVLDGLVRTAAANDATLVPVDRSFVRAREPHVRAAEALWSPDTGWIEAEALVRTLQQLAVASRGVAARRHDVRRRRARLLRAA